MNQVKINELIDEVISEVHSIYETIKQQYPNGTWEDMTQAEKQLLLWINDFEMKYKPMYQTDKN